MPDQLEVRKMSSFDIRLFHDDASIVAIGEGLLAATLPRDAWTHEAHLAACSWLVRDRANIDIERELPAIISAYNIACGGVNDDAQGYHETITQVYIAGVRAHLAEVATDLPLYEAVNRLLLSPRGTRDLPLRFYSKELLFSAQARWTFVAPDLVGLDQM
jgi:type III secretion system FlhB-like substrate exporter